jgi:hypothetical protein
MCDTDQIAAISRERSDMREGTPHEQTRTKPCKSKIHVSIKYYREKIGNHHIKPERKTFRNARFTKQTEAHPISKDPDLERDSCVPLGTRTEQRHMTETPDASGDKMTARVHVKECREKQPPRQLPHLKTSYHTSHDFLSQTESANLCSKTRIVNDSISDASKSHS